MSLINELKMYDNSSIFQFNSNKSLYFFLKSNNNLNTDECNDEVNVESVYELSQKKQQQYNKGTVSKSNCIDLFQFVYECSQINKPKQFVFFDVFLQIKIKLIVIFVTPVERLKCRGLLIN